VVRILLVEPMSLLRGALTAFLAGEDDLEIAGELARIEEAVPIARRLRPDVAVVDLAADSDLDTLDQFRKDLPDCAVLILVDVDAPGAVHGRLMNRVDGFIGKDTPPAQLAQYIRRVASGDRVIDPSLAVAAWSARRNPLRRRECEILRIAAEGRTSQEIARELHLSVGTVRNYLSSIMRKTGARTRLEAIRIAIDSGWL
jgi:two-component system, NarL family, response regulator DesR